MCRLLAISPNIKRKEALAILGNMLGTNTDGVGYVYVKNGQFITKKFPYSLEKVLENKRTSNDFLSHLPHDGITLIHLRRASHGVNLKCNTHPFIIGEGKKSFALIHNGVWHDHNVARLALSKTVNFNGQTDSETAGQLLNIIGVKKFTNEINMAGVFMLLKLDGTLSVIKTSGELSIVKQKGGKLLLASELDFNKYPSPKQLEALTGYYQFDNKLRYLFHREKKSHFIWNKPINKSYFDDDDDDECPCNTQEIHNHSEPTVSVTERVYDSETNTFKPKIKTLPLSSFKKAARQGATGRFDFGGGHFHGE